MLESFAFATFVLITDQLSKLLILHHLAAGQVVILWGPLQLRRIANSGGAFFGLLKSPIAFVLIWMVVSVAFVWLNQLRAFSDNQMAALGSGLAWGGATSNLFDRIWRRAIIDFFDVRLCPVFNLADVAIVIGATFAFWALILTNLFHASH